MARKNSELEDDLPKKKVNKESLQDLLRLFVYLHPYRWKFGVSLGFLFLSSLTSLAFPYAIGKLVDSALKGTGTGLFADLDSIALLLMGVLVLQAIFSFMRIVWFVEVGERALADLRRDLYARLIILPMSFFGQRRVGELASRISTDVAQIQDTFTFTLAEFLRATINLIVGIAIILATSLKLTGVMLASFPVVIVAAVIFGKYIRKISKQAQDKLAEAGVVVEETLQGIQNVKAFTNENYELRRYRTAIDEVVQAAITGGKYRGAFASFIIFSLFGVIVFILWYGGGLVRTGEITVGELTSFLIYTTFVGASFGGLSEYYSQLQKTLGATERVRELLYEPAEAISPEKPKEAPIRLNGQIEFQNVEFAYPSRKEVQVLHTCNFKIEPGEKVAIVGYSGAGKTTIIALLMRLYAPIAGTIYLDGLPAQDYALQDTRANMALVPQDVFLFGGTIHENIRYGKMDATNAEIESAARQAFAHDFISSFPEGYQTVVGERGVKLSGGQRQRIAIARAILRNPSILLLDEATSSLDSESEKYVQAALEQLMQNRTTLIVAHRLATIRNADKILVVHQGTVVEAGTHEQLMLLENGLYRSLATLQFDYQIENQSR